MLSDKGTDGYEGKKCDIWSLGVTIYCIIFGTLPFDDELLINLFAQIEKGEYFSFILRFKFPNMNKELEIYRKIMSSMMQVDPDLRPTAEQLIAIFSEENLLC